MDAGRKKNESGETDWRKHVDRLPPPTPQTPPPQTLRLGFSELIASAGVLLAQCTVCSIPGRLLLASWHLISTSHPHLYFSYFSLFPLLLSLPLSLSLSASYIKKHISIMFTDQPARAGPNSWTAVLLTDFSQYLQGFNSLLWTVAG